MRKSALWAIITNVRPFARLLAGITVNAKVGSLSNDRRWDLDVKGVNCAFPFETRLAGLAYKRTVVSNGAVKTARLTIWRSWAIHGSNSTFPLVTKFTTRRSFVRLVAPNFAIDAVIVPLLLSYWAIYALSS